MCTLFSWAIENRVGTPHIVFILRAQKNYLPPGQLFSVPCCRICLHIRQHMGISNSHRKSRIGVWIFRQHGTCTLFSRIFFSGGIFNSWHFFSQELKQCGGSWKKNSKKMWAIKKGTPCAFWALKMKTITGKTHGMPLFQIFFHFEELKSLGGPYFQFLWKKISCHRFSPIRNRVGDPPHCFHFKSSKELSSSGSYSSGCPFSSSKLLSNMLAYSNNTWVPFLIVP